MKVTVQLIFIIVVSQFVFGCENKENAENPSQDTAVSENAIETKILPTETAAPQAQQPEPESENPTPAIVEKSVELPTAAALKGLEWIKGGPVKIEQEKIYIIEFWATWCGPCKISIPHLTEIQKKYKDKNVTVIGISNEDTNTVKPFVKKMGDQMDYTIAVDLQGFAQRNYMNAFGAQGIPHAFIVDRNGKIAWHGHPVDGMDTILELVVAGNFDPVLYAKQKAEAEALQRQLMSWYTEYFREIETNGLNDDTKQLAENFIEKAPADGLDAFAWSILNRVKEADRDLDAALKAAEKANQLVEGKEPTVLDTYALALFENGKIEKAIQAQLKLIDLAKDYPQAQQHLLETLEKYKAAAKEKSS